jgi:uncharacterized protein (DUF1778 family)
MALRPASRRINMRLSDEQENLLRQAAAEQGESLTGFVLAAATARARQVIEQAQRIELSRATFARFAEALNDPVEDMPTLRRYARPSWAAAFRPVKRSASTTT